MIAAGLVRRPFQDVYKPFFLAAIFIALTLGATWGARLLWSIADAGTFTAASLHQINAHGEAQILGWVGLFIMGFASQAFPRMWQTTLAGRRLIPFVLAGMIIGLIVRTIGMSLTGEWELALHAAMVGSALNVMAAWTFVAMIVATFERSRKKFEPYHGFIFASLGWLAISTVFSMVHTWLTMTAGSREELLFYVATYQGALRDAQIHGVALMMILGVSLRIVPPMFRLPAVSPRRQCVALALLSIGVAAEVAFFIGFRWTESPVLAGCLYGSWMMLAAGVVTIVSAWRPCHGAFTADRSAKFVRAAYLWLLISFTLLLLIPVHQLISGMHFSHAYYGAIRHAITVGFVSMMIVGIGSKVIPSLRGFNSRTMSSLWGPFILLNVGCATRVITQTLTDFQPEFFRIIGVSGTLEVVALGWWGLAMVRILCRRAQPHAQHVRVDISAPKLNSRVMPHGVVSSNACCSACATRSKSSTAVIAQAAAAPLMYEI